MILTAILKNKGKNVLYDKKPCGRDAAAAGKKYGAEESDVGFLPWQK